MSISKATSWENRLREERLRRNWRQHDLAEQLGTSVVTIQRWEKGSQQPSAYFRVKLCALFDKSVEELGLCKENAPPPASAEREPPETGMMNSSSSAKEFALWTVPYPRNPHFTGRDDLLDQLAQRLSPKRLGDPTTTRRAVLTQSLAIKGLGGIGKTQIAVEYAYRALEQNRYTHTLWVNAANEETVITSFAALAELLPAFPAKNETNQHKLVAAVKHWLEQCQQSWLLIFDNAENVTLVRDYFPQLSDGSLLLTTRTQAVGSLATSIDVENMGLMEGTAFLLQRAQRQQASDSERTEATSVAMALSSFPLALDQAGAYIEETGCSFGQYLQLYQNRRKALLARRGTQITNYPDSVTTTWSLSFQQVEQANPAAAELLRLCAFLAPDRIPEELLKDGAPYWPPLLQQAAADLFSFNQLLEELLRFSLVKRLSSDHLISIHRLMQAVQMDALEPEEQQKWTECVIRAINATFPHDPKAEVSTWPQCLRYLDQAQACDALIQRYQILVPEVVDILEHTGIFLREYASYALAEPLLQRALQVCEQQLGAEHPRVASVLYNLGLLYYVQGKYAEAEPLFQRGLCIREQAFGPNHPLIVILLNGLAILYREQGNCAEAEPLLQRALCIREQALGPDHLLVATPLYNLASLYQQEGRYTAAAPLYQRALHIREQRLEPNHPDLAYPLYGLAELNRKQKRHVQAEALYKRALVILEQQIGPEHPKVASVLHGLAELYREQRKDTQAETCYQRALTLREQQLGPRHPDTAESLHDCAGFQKALGNLQEAVSLYQRALTIREQVLGFQHPKTAETRERLRAVFVTLGEGAATLGMSSDRLSPSSPGTPSR